LWGVDPIVLGFAAVNGLHVEGMAEDERDVLPGAEIGEPVPAEDALGGDDQVVAVGLDGLEEEIGIAAQVAVQELLAALVVEDAEVHRSSVQVDAAVVSMTAGVETHGSPPGLDDCVALSSFLPMLGRSRRGLHEYQAVAASMGRRKSREGWFRRRSSDRPGWVGGREIGALGASRVDQEARNLRTNFYSCRPSRASDT